MRTFQQFLANEGFLGFGKKKPEPINAEPAPPDASGALQKMTEREKQGAAALASTNPSASGEAKVVSIAKQLGDPVPIATIALFRAWREAFGKATSRYTDAKTKAKAEKLFGKHYAEVLKQYEPAPKPVERNRGGADFFADEEIKRYNNSLPNDL